jgi:hypothetical protein
LCFARFITSISGCFNTSSEALVASLVVSIAQLPTLLLIKPIAVNDNFCIVLSLLDFELVKSMIINQRASLRFCLIFGSKDIKL